MLLVLLQCTRFGGDGGFGVCEGFFIRSNMDQQTDLYVQYTIWGIWVNFIQIFVAINSIKQRSMNL